ncbi:hypothetical protein VP01_885g6 [Puccinia sorghi]|uniref:Ubiquitinyl hydrolase 1 n=1 Tax=Puccinia sorghi TaxID=27349 RepID=A0A0L6U8Z6_9BASI|nr:hypothetical protein VP01_885g6 [Puccinia sorghi]
MHSVFRSVASLPFLSLSIAHHISPLLQTPKTVQKESTKSSSLHSFVFLLLLPLFFLLGGGANVFRSHHSASNHAKKTGHSLALNIQRTRKPDSHQRSPSAEPPLKKLAITEQTQDLFDIKTSLIHYAPDDDRKELSSSDLLEPKVSKEKKNFCDRISFFQKLIVFAGSRGKKKLKLATTLLNWTKTQTQPRLLKVVFLSFNQSYPTFTSQQPLKFTDHHSSLFLAASATCHACELSSNLWLCLQCGSLGCGRPQYGGTGGNGHALQHYGQTGHCVNVKLGTITAEGTADLYCYSCDDARTDARLQEHLAHFAIEIASLEKTEKSMTELECPFMRILVDESLLLLARRTRVASRSGSRIYRSQELRKQASLLNLDISKHTNRLITLQAFYFNFVPLLSCYIASVLQVLFALPPFQKRYYQGIFELHSSTCEAANPADCFDCQMNKIAHGLLSGRYAVSSNINQKNGTRDDPHDGASSFLKSFQEGIKPMMFKVFVGKGHPEFSTMRQQDADEFMRYLFQFIQRQARQSSAKASLLSALGEDDLDPTLPFRFELEEKLQCSSCQCVRYRYEEQEALSLPVPAVPLPPPKETESAEFTLPVQTTYQPVTLEECLESFTTPQTVEYNCPRCKCKTTALALVVLCNACLQVKADDLEHFLLCVCVDDCRTSRIASFPQYLAIHTRRFAIINWVPRKLANIHVAVWILEIPVVIQGHEVDLEKFFGSGIQPGEEQLPEVEEERGAHIRQSRDVSCPGKHGISYRQVSQSHPRNRQFGSRKCDKLVI